jgi:hypothetical protein
MTNTHLSEEGTFNRLRRVPVEKAYPLVKTLMGKILHRDDLQLVDTNHPEVKEYMGSLGWSRGKDLVDEYEKWIRHD